MRELDLSLPVCLPDRCPRGDLALYGDRRDRRAGDRDRLRRGRRWTGVLDLDRLSVDGERRERR